VSQLVHVVLASGTRFQHEFPDSASPEQIVAAVAKNKDAYGRTGRAARPDGPGGMVVFHADGESPFAFDDPAVVVAVGRDEGGEFVETIRLKGPKP
jgi:hypothetical protein